MISYKPLFHLLIERDISREKLKEITNLAPSTISKIYTGKYVALDVIERICLALDVPIQAVVAIKQDPVKETPEEEQQ